ncbi:MAG: hypothetical protein RLZZ399_1496 [Verrucomicrobiota bacterium]|jgi:hypothetical protein
MNPPGPEHPSLSRRDFLFQSGIGLGAVAIHSLHHQAAAADRSSPLRPKTPPQLARAKSVIFLFMEGGPSHIDLFDPKPLLNELAGKPMPESFGSVITAMGESRAPLLGSRRTWKQHGQSGLWISDWLPYTAQCADDLAVIRSCRADGINHSAGVCQMNSGSILGGRPSLGSWVSYGLGSENNDLPSFVVLQDSQTSVVNGPRNWGSGFMPAVYQGVRMHGGSEPVPHLNTPDSLSADEQASKIELIRHLNQGFADRYPDRTELAARLNSYELAFRMQAEAPGAVDLHKESEATRRLYGADRPETASMARLCMLSRRLVERGVRFVQIYHGAGSKWDAHKGIEKNHSELCRSMDQPVAALLRDLKARGMLEDTLVVWGGEFGRTPMSEKGDGRDHNPTGFTMWMAGGGVKGGQCIGATDELGLRAIDTPLHVHDLHATILWLLGLDNMGLVYTYKGRPERPTLNEGEPYTAIAL